MTRKDVYDALVYSYGYKRDGCYPLFTRYDEKYRNARETYSIASEMYDELIKEKFGKDTDMDYNNTKIFVDGLMYKTHDVTITTEYGEYPLLTASAYLHPYNKTSGKNPGCTYRTSNKSTKLPTIENVIFNPPATIVFWSDKTKTIVKCDYSYEDYDPEKGIAMAIAKKLMGDNKGNYYNLFKHWREKWDKQNEVVEDIKIDISNNPISKLSDSLKSAFIKPTTDWLDELEP